MFRFHPLASITIPTGERIDILVPAEPIGIIVKSKMLLNHFFPRAENVGLNPRAIPPVILSPSRFRVIDHLIDDI